VQELLQLADEARKDLGDDLQNKVGIGNRMPGNIIK
jgi:hypothetical protein